MNYQIVGGDGKEYGPISAGGVNNWIQEGRANGDTRIKKVGTEEWKCVRDLPEFANAFSTAISPPPSLPVTHPPVVGQSSQQKPGKLQAIAIMTLVGGIIAVLASLYGFINVLFIGAMTLGIGCFCIIIPIYELIAGILCIIQGSKLLGSNPDLYYAKTKNTAIMQIICIISLDVLNMTMGIINLVFLNDEEVKTYIRSRGGRI